MKLQNLLSGDERAVSPVIGVILMVAITVILAAVIGSFVLNLGNSVQETTPNANFDIEYTANSTTWNVTATHTGGDTIPSTDNVNLTADGSFTEVSNFSGEVSAGDSAEISDVANSTTVRVLWVSQNGQTSQALATDETPANP